MKNDLVQVAKLGKSVGLKGYLKLHNLSDFFEQFKRGAKFFDINQKIYTIKDFDQNKSLVLFENYENLDLAKTLTNTMLYQTKEFTKQNCILEKDEYFYFDIIGCEIIEDDKKIGVVEDILENGIGFLFLAKSEDELIRQSLAKKFYIPYVDKYIQKIDIENKKIFTKYALELLENS
ncbi:16S rRNA processing protein RimM [Campylobacter volucris]|uniref:ribosome maturation factor RimM n=1 Tax=Campylobacter volucris TaxID=1031542 RepID=UPI0010595EAA|nr:ribosome maturation factor RimM [Campylobacter volucris]TDJ87836.1 16S rRNA processing protein RimM [Campylobacter volucris]